MIWQRIQAGAIATSLLAACAFFSLGSGEVQAAPPAPQSLSLPDLDPHKAFGQKNAPVVVEIFSDFQCPACRQYYVNTNRQLMDNYVNTGKVYLVHRDFPLPMHAYSRVAARYARAAAQLGKFEKVEDALFQNQQKWDQTGDVDGTVAAALGPAEMTKLRALLKNPAAIDAMIEKDIALGKTYNVSQTPTSVFHAKGQNYPYGGGIDYQFLKQFLDQLIGQK